MISLVTIDSTLLALDTIEIVLKHDYILFYAPYEKSNCGNKFQKKKKLIPSCITYTHTPQIDRQMKRTTRKKQQQQKSTHTQVHAMYEVQQMKGKKKNRLQRFYYYYQYYCM